eukprot:1270065-Prorocentrum_lima.AAC.1
MKWSQLSSSGFACETLKTTLCGDGQQYQDFIDLDEETPLIALKLQDQAGGAEIGASLQDVEDPA